MHRSKQRPEVEWGRHGWRPRRGDMRGILLAGLLDGPAHGYELMRRLESATSSRWRPSPGSVYPLLQQLEDESLVQCTEVDGRKVYELTSAGVELADRDALGRLADAGAGSPHHRELIEESRMLVLAARQVAAVGSQSQVERAAEVVRGARQALYRVLADQ